MATAIGINGFGRIGRLVFRSIWEREDAAFEIVGINDLTDVETLAHLLKYDSVHGTLPAEVAADDGALVVDGERFPVFNEKDPTQLPWDRVGCNTVVESSGVFRTRDSAAQHLDAGAERVVISAPARDKVDATVVLGVNDDILTGDEQVVSNASCTTNCLAPMVKVIDEQFGLKSGLMTTVHAYTSSQNIVDGPHKDLRRARAAAESIIPTTTGAAKAVELVLPHLEGRLDGMAMRVPIPNGSVTDLVVNLEQDVTTEEVNDAFRQAAHGPLQGIVSYTEDPIVSRDIVHDPHSVIVDGGSTMAAGSMVKLLGWYDNEWGYANRTIDLVGRLAKVGQPA